MPLRARALSGWGGCLLAVAGALVFTGEATAQIRRNWQAPTVLDAGLLPRRPDLENLLRTGEDALERRDWKLAIDSLQRIIDDESGALLPAGEQQGGYVTRESARRRATALLADMPPEGIAAYRLLTDGIAENLWQKALTEGDESALRTLVDRYLITSRGDDAADLLAIILMDKGLPADALDVIERLDAWCHDRDVPARRVALKRAVCWLMLGDRVRAEAALGEVLDTTPTDEATERVAALVASGWQDAGEALADAGGESWPLVAGDLARSCHMPATSPELRENLPWRYTLPADEPDWWDREYLQHLDRERGLPASRPVVADGRVFVKWVNQIVALDLESLDFLWQTDPAPETSLAPSFRLLRNRAVRDQQVFDRYSTRDRLLHDYVGSGLAVADGMLFEVDRNGVGVLGRRPDDQVKVEQSGIRSVWQGSRLIAHRADSGETVWERGRTADASDPLGDVHFLGVPMALPERFADGTATALWTVYARQNDIYLGVLAPRDGALLRELLLCSVDARETDSLLHEAVSPAYDGRTMYVTLSAGLVIAVDTERFALRWATSYPREPHITGSLAAANWLCGPPIVSGRVIVAAPPDCARLLGLDRANGTVLWSYPRPADVYYVLGADDRRVWLGGNSFVCLALDTGAEVWRSIDMDALKWEPTGRAAWSGKTIHIPTTKELVTISADTGEVVDETPLPADQLPLGNLLCLASALFSVDTNEVRKFPDLTVSYPRQLARFESDPKNEQAAVRLAWMELLRGEPRRTLTVLDAVRSAARAKGRYGGEISRLTIDAMLRLAARDDTGDVEAVQYLEKALTLTNRDIDQLRATLALAARWRKMGRGDDAYLKLWRLGMTPAGDDYVTIEPRLRNKARQVVAHVLARFERDLTARQLATIQAATQDELDAALAELNDEAHAAEGRQRLLRLAELDDAGGAGQAALVALGGIELSQQHYERSEQYLREAIRRNRATAVTAEAMRDLAEQYLGDDQKLDWEAQQLLDRLKRSYSGVTLPAGAGTVAVADEVERLQGLVDSAAAASDAAAAERKSLVLKAQPSGNQIPHLRAASLVEYVGAPAEAANRFALLFDEPGTVHAVAPGAQRVSWSVDLELPGAAPDPTAERGQRNEWSPDFHAIAFCDGQTAVINGPNGLFGVGLLTGRRLWGVTYEDEATADRAALRNRLMAVDRGRLICAPRRGVLSCSSVLDGNDVHWERILTDERVDTVTIKDDYCITLDNQRERATAYDAASGRRVAALKFTQPGAAVGVIPLVYDRGQLVGPTDARTVACYSLETPGEPNWRYTMPQDVRWIFNAGDGYVGVCSVEGYIRLLDILEGDVVLSAQLPTAAAGYAEGVIHDDALLLMIAARSAEGPNPSLVSLDLATGKERWSSAQGYGACGAGPFALWKLLHVADDVVPIFRRVETPSSNTFLEAKGRIVVEMVDKKTGKTVGPSVDTNHAVTLNERLTGEFGLWPGHLLVGTQQGVLVLSTTEQAVADEAKNAGEVKP
ncbi:MAG TPA: PQQ-binding-like beta-propeller repeat protein [Phycisphaerae bacterium]|nr:PQQ-binding-like beta-propeller repeat protein [Phycisphaerae bacterium]